MASKALATALLALVALAGAARAEGDIATVGQPQTNADELTHPGRSLQTFGLFSALWCKLYALEAAKFSLVDKLFFHDGSFSRLNGWNGLRSGDQDYNYDRHPRCSCYVDRCANRCGGLDYYWEEKSWNRYWCPRTCGVNNYGIDFWPSRECGRFQHLCNPYQGSCYHWYSRPFRYWCQKSCGIFYGKK